MKNSMFVYVKTMDGEVRLVSTEIEARAGDCVLVNETEGENLVSQCVSGSFEADHRFIGKALNCDPEALPMVVSLLVPEWQKQHELTES